MSMTTVWKSKITFDYKKGYYEVKVAKAEGCVTQKRVTLADRLYEFDFARVLPLAEVGPNKLEALNLLRRDEQRKVEIVMRDLHDANDRLCAVLDAIYAEGKQ